MDAELNAAIPFLPGREILAEVRLSDVRVLKLEPGEILAIILPPGRPVTQDLVLTLRAYFAKWFSDDETSRNRYMLFEHGTELAVVKAEEAST